MVINIEIDPTWLENQKIAMPVKKIIGMMYETEYMTLGKVMENLSEVDIVGLKALYDQHLEEILIGQRSGKDTSEWVGIYNVTVMTILALLGEGVPAVTIPELTEAKKALGIILTIEASAVMTQSSFQSVKLYRDKYTVSDSKDKIFATLIRKPQNEK